ncbi:nitronate monooxygenase [Aspergillus fischeri NRRL 181]|uniref:Oxidoreductase 2-nitropropane dioxygenase family, putative n=1 Tax=Neosartorya fischeri (strain ATCC 1020 / DSM 3700 / CBS 544.65 / FGSC A1164 / JCM 1740 / NRRL 181 / WB 181) TaxID=331117 RepID=A1DIW5_NEOFI|nr:oxidoreductase 2-nitropropane dioxygenase family, putative [Aspergillus fischeri NRRL 181]EAW19322.1 oxidoreductase 2-nitropropane dioxygenase family, putative [Aspergillus fischeri NRRL 181]
MSQLITTISRSYPWMKTPFIVSAPMRVMSGPTLAVAVSRAGGLGFIGPGVKTQDISSDLQKASSLIKSLPVSQSQPSTLQNQPVLPVGVGFQLWSDDLEVAISTITKYQPCAAWLFAPRNGQKDLDTWSRRIRHASPSTRIWIQIGTLAEARELAQGSEEPDVIVVQGAEAGGHGRANDGLGIMTLLPEMMDCLPAHIPVFAAGGIADGRGAAAALCLGATGVVMGTRFLAATEARISPGYQREIVRASNGAVSTTRTLLYNRLRGTVGWPEEYSPRTIINKSFIEHQAGRPFDELKELHDEALKAGDAGWGPEGRLATYAGAAIGLIHEVKDAETIVQVVQEEVLQRLSNVQKANSAQ